MIPLTEMVCVPVSKLYFERVHFLYLCKVLHRVAKAKAMRHMGTERAKGIYYGEKHLISTERQAIGACKQPKCAKRNLEITLAIFYNYTI